MTPLVLLLATTLVFHCLAGPFPYLDKRVPRQPLPFPALITIDWDNLIPVSSCLNAETRIIPVQHNYTTECHHFSAQETGDGYSSTIWLSENAPCTLGNDDVFGCSKGLNSTGLTRWKVGLVSRHRVNMSTNES